ncbi:hypothetical protein ACIBQ5_18590 [Streptomyces massasporeus]|uniref:hypothetical protein n=1 Tax=Streptomyces massasporeus TaxID=67324 RepID=UPI00378DA0D3
MRSVMWILLAVVTLAVVTLGVGVASAREIGGALDREREYRGAPACAAVPVETSGCVWEQEFTVRSETAAKTVRWHGVALGATAILTLWAQAANEWPLWAVPAIWGPLALLIPASMTAFALGALRCELDDDAPASRQPEPQTA